MTLYFDGPTNDSDTFTISVPNVDTQEIWRLLLSGEYPHKLEPKDPDAVEPWKAIDLTLVETNDRYTTFKPALNANYIAIKDNFYNGIYNIKIGADIDQIGERYIYEGTVKLITAASEDATRNIKKYESDDESNSGYVFYSEKL